MRVRVTTQGGTADITKLLTTYAWSGNKGSCARSFDFTMAVSETAARLPRVDVPVGSVAELLTDDGTEVFTGYVVQRKVSTEGSVLTHRCLDRGQYLARNSGWYTVKGTPEAAVRRICGDFGIPVGTLAATGVQVARKFPGVALNKIIGTLYTMAAEQTKKRYLVRFDGGGRLTVAERAEGAGGATIAPRVNLMQKSVTESIEKMCNSVAIYDQYGNLIRTVDDAEAVKLYGRMQQAVTQKDKTDAAAKAATLLEDGGLAQDIDVDCLGDLSLTTGTTVLLRDGGSGTVGVFWIDSDVHTWKNGLYVCRLGLNLKNVMDKETAGTEVK